MKIEDQVCSLELAKRLKELGVKQEGLFKWASNDNKVTFHIWPNPQLYAGDFIAFTVAELGEMLPSYLNEEFLIIEKEKDYWSIHYDVISSGHHQNRLYTQEDKSLANTMAKMLIHLLENGLIKNDG